MKTNNKIGWEMAHKNNRVNVNSDSNSKTGLNKF